MVSETPNELEQLQRSEFTDLVEQATQIRRKFATHETNIEAAVTTSILYLDVAAVLVMSVAVACGERRDVARDGFLETAKTRFEKCMLSCAENEGGMQ